MLLLAQRLDVVNAALALLDTVTTCIRWCVLLHVGLDGVAFGHVAFLCAYLLGVL